MPELPEVETVRRGLAPSMEGALIYKVEQNRADLRFPFDLDLVETLEGATIKEIGRRAKYLLFYLDNDSVLISHLGMSGSFRIIHDDEERQPGEFHHEKNKNEKHDHLVIYIEKNNVKLRIAYNDPRRFGFMVLTNKNELHDHKFLKDMGPEPTGNGVGTEYLAEKFKNRKTPLKSALLDQKIIAGLGNIYVCEALWRSRLSPLTQIGSLVKKNGHATAKLGVLAENIRDVIADAIKAGGSSLQDHIQADGSLGYFQHSFAVYGQENKPCKHHDCAGEVIRITQSGRSSFYCPECQK